MIKLLTNLCCNRFGFSPQKRYGLISLSLYYTNQAFLGFLPIFLARGAELGDPEYNEYGGGAMIEPCSRTSIHKCPEFKRITKPPYWNDYTGVWCGNHFQDEEFSTCGRCGDPPMGSECIQGGTYDKKVITATYTEGSIIDVIAHFIQPHYGFFQLDLCAQEIETNTCFTPLRIVGGSEQRRGDGRICVPYEGIIRNVTARVQLPKGVRCSRCTLRWTYRTSYEAPEKWDPCYDPRYALTFRNCADIAIVGPEKKEGQKVTNEEL